MSKRSSKNNPLNRQERKVNSCYICNTVKKPVRFVNEKVNKMCFECECGIVDKNGVVMVSREELEKEIE
jgi:hypothetical protein